jgi:Mrp family chromosome partitioning ATPase
MSKNFELLQQVGHEEELFQADLVSREADPTKSGQPGAESEREARETILRNASLPDVFQASSKVAELPLAEAAELSGGLQEKSEPRNLQTTFPSVGYRTSRNASSPIGDPAKGPKNGVTPSNGNNGSRIGALSAGNKLKASQEEASGASGPEMKKEPTPRIFRSSSSPRPWVGAMRTAASRWGWRAPGSANHHGPRGIDVDGIAREEEVKLVERVFRGTDQDSTRMAVFAGLAGDAGCASICARAGELLAARGEGPVCVVDANFRLPALHRYFGVENEKGLAEATLETGPIQKFAQQIPEPDLWLMPSGTAASNLSFPAMADGLRVRIAELRETFRYVVIHSGPLRLESRAMLLSRWTDGVVLVLEANATRRDAARRAKENLAAAGVSVLGVVLNNRTFPIPEAIYRRL